MYSAIYFGPRSKNISWFKTVSSDFSWDRSLFLFIAHVHKKRCSATKDFAVLLKKTDRIGDGMRLYGIGWDWKDEGNGTEIGFI